MSHCCAPRTAPYGHHCDDVKIMRVIHGVGLLAYRDWHATSSEQPRSHFMAMMGVAISAFCALLVLAQWLALAVFGTGAP